MDPQEVPESLLESTSFGSPGKCVRSFDSEQSSKNEKTKLLIQEEPSILDQSPALNAKDKVIMQEVKEKYSYSTHKESSCTPESVIKSISTDKKPLRSCSRSLSSSFIENASQSFSEKMDSVTKEEEPNLSLSSASRSLFISPEPKALNETFAKLSENSPKTPPNSIPPALVCPQAPKKIPRPRENKLGLSRPSVRRRLDFDHLT